MQACCEFEDHEAKEGRLTMQTAIQQAPRRADIVGLLEGASLPTSDLSDGDMKEFFYAGPATAPIGIVGLQFYGSDAMIPSLVVRRDHREKGLGQKLVAHAEQHARTRGATTIYLLTTTAEHFFRARGYVATPRDSAPPAIRSTPEFAG